MKIVSRGVGNNQMLVTQGYGDEATPSQVVELDSEIFETVELESEIDTEEPNE